MHTDRLPAKTAEYYISQFHAQVFLYTISTLEPQIEKNYMGLNPKIVIRANNDSQIAWERSSKPCNAAISATAAALLSLRDWSLIITGNRRGGWVGTTRFIDVGL